MNSPSITDWLQAGGSIFAVILASISLFWQWRTTRPKRPEVIKLRTTGHGNLWELDVSVSYVSHGAALRCTVEVLTGGGGVIPLDSIPYSSGQLSPAVFITPGKNFDAMQDAEGTRSLSSLMSHSPVTADASAAFVITWPKGPPQFAEIRVSLTDGNVAFPFRKEKRRISPVS